MIESSSPTESVREFLLQKRSSLTHTPDVVRIVVTNSAIIITDTSITVRSGCYRSWSSRPGQGACMSSRR